MKPEQTINKFRAGNHLIAIYFDDNSRYVMVVESNATYGKEWAFTDYNKALAVAEWLCSLSDYQRDVVILEVSQ